MLLSLKQLLSWPLCPALIWPHTSRRRWVSRFNARAFQATSHTLRGVWNSGIYFPFASLLSSNYPEQVNSRQPGILVGSSQRNNMPLFLLGLALGCHYDIFCLTLFRPHAKPAMTPPMAGYHSFEALSSICSQALGLNPCSGSCPDLRLALAPVVHAYLM